MKVFAIQKAQVNTGASRFNQNNSQNSKQVSFGMPSIKENKIELAKLDEKLRLKQITEETYRKLARPIKDEIRSLEFELGIRESGGGWDPAKYAAEHPYD